MYYRPTVKLTTCSFQIGHAAAHSAEIIKEDPVEQPCDGIHWARFRVAGSDIAFIAHLKNTNYKGTPVTLLEIRENRIPTSLHVVY